MKKNNFLILAGAALAAYESLWVFFSALSDRDWVWTSGAGLCFAAVVLVAWGMLRKNPLALKASWLLALGSLSLGIYLTHFKWTFWIFKEPTLRDRLISVTIQNIDGILMILLAIFWLLYFTRPNVRGSFKTADSK
jgi:peptidoglycan/LPS O-acetylase OafA/YrhL